MINNDFIKWFTWESHNLWIEGFGNSRYPFKLWINWRLECEFWTTDLFVNKVPIYSIILLNWFIKYVLECWYLVVLEKLVMYDGLLMEDWLLSWPCPVMSLLILWFMIFYTASQNCYCTYLLISFICIKLLPCMNEA